MFKYNPIKRYYNVEDSITYSKDNLSKIELIVFISR